MENNCNYLSKEVKKLSLEELNKSFDLNNNKYRALLNNFIEVKHNIEQLLDYNFRYMNYKPSKSILEEVFINVNRVIDKLGKNLFLIENETNFSTIEEAMIEFDDIYQKLTMLEEDMKIYGISIKQNIIDWSYYFCDDDSKKKLISKDSQNNEKLLELSNSKNFSEIFNYISKETLNLGRKLLNISVEEEQQALKFIVNDDQYKILKSRGYDQLFWDLLKYDGEIYMTYYDFYVFFYKSVIVTIIEDDVITNLENLEPNKQLCIVMDQTEEDLLHKGYEAMKEVRSEGYKGFFYDSESKGGMIYEYLGFPKKIRFYLKSNKIDEKEYTMEYFSKAIYGKYV